MAPSSREIWVLGGPIRTLFKLIQRLREHGTVLMRSERRSNYIKKEKYSSTIQDASYFGLFLGDIILIVDGDLGKRIASILVKVNHLKNTK